MQSDLISLESGPVWILPFSHLHILWLTYTCPAARLWPLLKLNLTYWRAETDAHLLLAACIWIKTMTCTVLLSWAALSHLLQLCLSPHCIAAETFWISVFPQVSSICAREAVHLQYGKKKLHRSEASSEVIYFSRTVSVAVSHNYKISLSYPFYF